MPQIKEYQQQVEPNATAPGKRVYPDAFETMTHNAGAGATALGEVLQREQEQTDTSNVHVMMAQARADWTNHLAQAAQGAATDVSMSSGQIQVGDGAATGDKPVPIVNVGNFSDKYMGDLSTYLTQAKQNVTTQAGSRLYDAMAANLHADLQEKAVGAQAHLTGLKAVADYNGALNNYRNVLLNDPSQFASVLKEASAGLGSWVEIPADQRIKLMEQTSEKLALSAVQGWIKIDPEGAAKQLQDGQWDNYLSASGKYQLEHQAQLGINMLATEQRRAELAAAREEKRKQMEVNDGFMGKFVAGELTMDDVRGSSVLQPFGEGSQNTWREMIDQQNKSGIGNIKSNKAAVMQAYQDIHRPDGDPHKMTNENTLNAGFGTLWGEHDLLFLRKELQDDRTPEGQRLNETKASFFKAMKPQLDKSTLLGNDPVGAEQAYKYQMYVEQLVDEAKAKHENPYDLFNPKSKNYVGQYLHLFQRSITEQVQDYSRGIPKPVTTTTPPEIGAPGQGMPHIEASPLPADDKRLPGETAEQWRKRTGR